MRGAITLSIKRRTYSPSTRYRDKWQMLDTVRFESVTINGQKFYKTQSRKTGQEFGITRDELAFVRFVYSCYGAGDYSIMIFGKGKNKGFRRFWDGIIMSDRKFFRRKESRYSSLGSSHFERESTFSIYTESFIGRYLKTQRPGLWYNF